MPLQDGLFNYYIYIQMPNQLTSILDKLVNDTSIYFADDETRNPTFIRLCTVITINTDGTIIEQTARCCTSNR